MSGGGSSAPAGNTTTTQVSTPWSGQQPYLSQEFAAAQGLYNNYSPQYFPTSTVSPFNPLQSTGQALEAGTGLSGGNPSVGASTNFLSGLENGNYLGTNPFTDPTAQSIMSQVVPGIEGTFNGGNRVNSPGAAFATAQGAANAVAPYEYQNYQNTLDQMLKGTALSPGLQAANYQNIGAVQDAGNQQQTQAQAQLNDAINRWNFAQQLPYNKLGTFGQMIGGNFGGTSTLTQPFFGPSTGSNLLGGALGGGALGGMLAPALGISGSNGALGGAGLGALLAFSDRRLKQDIWRIGTSQSGLPVYVFRYAGEPEVHIGLMADDVEITKPEAVRLGIYGFKMVDYAMALEH